jgi:lipopolysaccharide export system protein LptA
MEARQMTVPVAGRLLYEDHRPPEAQKDEDGGPANRGTTAFEWRRQLTYDDAKQIVVMQGDVDINHVPDDEKGQSFRIATQRVTAEMEQKPKSATEPTTLPATGPTTEPATSPSPLPGGIRLKRVTADGGVNVRAKRFQFTATRLTYSPTTGILTAHGAPGDPITLTDEQGQVDSAIESLTWNTKTDQVNLKGGRGRVRP